MVGSGHKWLCGGPGTGICYIRTSGSNLPPLAPGNFILYGNQFGPSPFFNNRAWPPNAFMQLRGDFNSPAVYAMSDSFSFMNYVGLQRIFNRGVDLGMYLKQKITQRWGQNALWVRAGDSSYRTALVAFNPFKGKNDPGQFANMAAAMTAISNNLANPVLNNGIKMAVRFTTWRDKSTDPGVNRIGLRMSTHAMYIDPPDDRLPVPMSGAGSECHGIGPAALTSHHCTFAVTDASALMANVQVPVL